MRHTEFWARMDDALGSTYAETWASMQVIGELGGRTVTESLEDGTPPKEVWRAVWRTLDLPPTKQ